MHVDAQAYLILVEVVHRIKMTQERISDQVQIFVLSWQSAFVDHEIAFSFIALIKVLLWSYLENIITHLETNRLDLLGNILAWRLDVAEGLVTFAIQLWETRGPLLSDLLEHIWRYGELRTASVYYCWVAGVLSWLLHGLGAVCHSLSLEGPSAKPIREVLEGLEAICPIDYL